MLVLTRKKGQAIIIGHDIEISVIDIQGDQVRIGINAPKSVSVHRKEIYEEIKNENLSAATRKGIDINELNKTFENKGKEESGQDT